MKIRPFFIFLFSTSILASCVTIYFDQPQPVDAKDLRKTPRAVRGTWIMGTDTATIAKRTFYWVEWYTDTVTSAEIESEAELEIRDGFIYDRSEKNPTGYRCEPLGEDWLVYMPERINYGLADSALLRKVTDNFYTFNLTKDGKWWEVFLVERTGDNALSIWYPGRTDVCLMEAIGAGEEEYLEEDGDPNTAFTNDFQKYWSVALTREKLLECYDLGAFGELVLELKSAWKQ